MNWLWSLVDSDFHPGKAEQIWGGGRNGIIGRDLTFLPQPCPAAGSFAWTDDLCKGLFAVQTWHSANPSSTSLLPQGYPVGKLWSYSNIACFFFFLTNLSFSLTSINPGLKILILYYLWTLNREHLWTCQVQCLRLVGFSSFCAIKWPLEDQVPQVCKARVIWEAVNVSL